MKEIYFSHKILLLGKRKIWEKHERTLYLGADIWKWFALQSQILKTKSLPNIFYNYCITLVLVYVHFDAYIVLFQTSSSSNDDASTDKWILIFPAVSHMSYSSYLDGLWDKR